MTEPLPFMAYWLSKAYKQRDPTSERQTRKIRNNSNVPIYEYERRGCGPEAWIVSHVAMGPRSRQRRGMGRKSRAMQQT